MFRPKAAKQEYEKYMLPKNRKEVFADVVKTNLSQFLIYGCIVFITSFPIHLSAILEKLYRAQLSGEVGAGELNADQAVMLASSSGNTLALTDILWYVLFAVSFSGLARVIRQHAWEESVYFRYEYGKGVRQNAGGFALLGLLAGMIRFACVWFRNMYFVNGADQNSFIGYLPTIWAVILLVPAALYLTVCIPLYDVKFYQNVKNAFLVYFKNIWKSLPAVAICVAVAAIRLLPGFWMQLAGGAAVSFALPFLALGWFLFAFDRLDESINKKLYPQLLGRGVFREEQQEEKETA